MTDRQPPKPEYMERVRKVARALAVKHYADRFATTIDDPQVQSNADGNWQIFTPQAEVAALALEDEATAARREALTEALSACRDERVWATSEGEAKANRMCERAILALSNAPAEQDGEFFAESAKKPDLSPAVEELLRSAGALRDWLSVCGVSSDARQHVVDLDAALSALRAQDEGVGG